MEDFEITKNMDGQISPNSTDSDDDNLQISKNIIDFTNSKEITKVSIVFYILGVVTMLPWNFFITADTYWQYKLRNTSLDDDHWDDDGVPLTDYQLSFTPTLVIISNGTMFFFGFFTSAIVLRTSEKSRVYLSFIGSLAAMGIVTVFSIVNTDEWQSTFYIVTMTAIALLNIGIAVLQGTLYGLAGFFPARCMSALVSGQALAGVVSSLSRIISLAAGEEDPVVSGIIYFVMADVFIVISIGAYFYLTRLTVYNDVKDVLDRKSETRLLERKTGRKKDYRRLWNIFKKIWWMGFTLGFTLLITLAVFPAVTVYITSSRPSSSWTDVYFQPTITFLLFNIFDMAGRELSGYVTWPRHKGWLLHVLSALRLAFIPLLLLCHGDTKSFPTFFERDFYYIILNIFFAFSNGYYGALTMVYYPRFVEEDEIEFAGSLMAAIMGVGMVIGSGLSPAFVILWGPNN